MTLYTDRKFLGLVSIKLDRFAKKGDDLWNCRCPLCGDSKTNRKKARGYFYRKRASIHYKCHNCGVGMSLGSFLKQKDAELFREYTLESYKESGYNNSYKRREKESKQEFILSNPRLGFNDFSFLGESLANLDENHFAKKYAMSRRIPMDYIDSLYYHPNFEELLKKYNPEEDYSYLKDDQRLVIPFMNKNRELIALQGRSLDPKEGMRYLTLKTFKDSPKIYGLDKVDYSKDVVVVEGPIDSMFVDNAIAMAGSSVSLEDLNFRNDQLIYVMDNQPRNKEVVYQIGQLIQNQNRVFFWPKEYADIKDINDLVLTNPDIDVNQLIKTNSSKGLKASMEYCKWKKI